MKKEIYFTGKKTYPHEIFLRATKGGSFNVVLGVQKEDNVEDPRLVVGWIENIEFSLDLIWVGDLNWYNHSADSLIIQAIGAEKFNLAPVGIGGCVEGVIQDDYQLLYFALLPKEKS